MASRLELHCVDEFINLTFCCQEVTVVTDFNDLETLGHRHYLTMNGGGASLDEMHDKDFREERGLVYPEDNHKFTIRPAFESESGIFYAMMPEHDAELAAIAHVRINFGHGGNEFWHTWHPRGDEALNSFDIKTDLSAVVNELRKTVLDSVDSGFRYETVTDNPNFCNAVDDIANDGFSMVARR